MLLQTTTLLETQRGVRLVDGQPVAWLAPGTHWTWWPGPARRIEAIDLSRGHTRRSPELDAVIPDGAAVALDVAPGEIALLDVDGQPGDVLLPGRYWLWQLRAAVTGQTYSTRAARTAIPDDRWPQIPATHLRVVTVAPHERTLLVVDGRVDALLDPGTHGIPVDGRSIATHTYDLRAQELAITGQEVMTTDQVTLRVNLHLRWQIVDPLVAHTAVANVRDAVYAAAQLAARRYLAGHRLDALLAHRGPAAEAMRDEARAQAAAWGVDLQTLEIKDLILPGDLRDVLGKVLTAEKEAAANVIRRREEIAATRSLANTAKMLAESPTLLRLKELEVLQDVASKVGQLTVVTGKDGLSGALTLG